MVPLVKFADRVRAISSTQLDLVGIADPPIPKPLADKLSEFDEVISWYGSNRAEFRELMPRWTFLHALPTDDSQEHASDFFLRQVGGVPGTRPRIEITPVSLRRTVVIHPFSGGFGKNWPLDRFRALAERLPVAIDWSAGPDEQLETAARFDNLFDLAKWMRGGAVYLGNDSGISHLAAALTIPSVILFGPTDPAIWAPQGKDVTILRHFPLHELPLADVAQAVLSKLTTT